MRTQSKKQANRLKRGKNACDHVEVGVGFASDWLGEWRQFSGPITKESLAKPMQFPIIVNAQLTIAPTNGTF